CLTLMVRRRIALSRTMRTQSGLILRDALRAAQDEGLTSRPRQIEDALGDDAEHHLRRAALDRVGLGAQPGARTRAAARPVALPLQRIDAASRHQDFVAALVQ